MPQIFCGRSSPMPYSKGRSRLANTTRAPADLPVSCTWTVIRAPNSNGPVVLTKAPCRFTTIVSPSHDSPVACTSMRTRIGTRVLRRRSLRRSLFALLIAPFQGIPSGPSPLFGVSPGFRLEVCVGVPREGPLVGLEFEGFRFANPASGWSTDSCDRIHGNGSPPSASGRARLRPSSHVADGLGPHGAPAMIMSSLPAVPMVMLMCCPRQHASLIPQSHHWICARGPQSG